MVNEVIMRCGETAIVLCSADAAGKISDISSYEIKFEPSSDEHMEEWLQAFSITLSQIPKKIRKSVTIVVPPNEEIFIKYLRIPEVTSKNIKEAFRFECEHNFPGGEDEWCWDVYQTEGQKNNAFGFAIRRAFSERIIDILIRNKIQFSFICPDVLLTTIAIKNYLDSSQNSMVAHVGQTMSYLACIGNNAEFFRILPIAGLQLNKTIAESQNFSMSRAEALQLEFLQNPDNENRAFMSYYIKQFSQKLQQEFKRSELFYCRTFKQKPITKLYLTGSRHQLYKHFKASDTAETIDLFEVLKDKIANDVPEEEINLIKDNIGTFVGAAYCIAHKDTSLLNLFTADFSDQVEFQRQNFGYLLFAVVITLLTLTGLKTLKKDVVNLETKKAALEAKLLETNIDITRYNEVIKEKEIIGSFIENAKFSLYSQSAWIDLFNELQSKIEILKTAWIESLTWSDKKENNAADKIKVSAKMLLIEENDKESVNKRIEKFISSLNKLSAIELVENVQIANIDENILTFSFGISLKQQSAIIVK